MGRLFLNVLWVVLLTVITQIGGVIYIIVTLLYRKKTFKKWSVFIVLYLICTYAIVPYVAPLFGREKIKIDDTIKIHMFFTSLTNRNYVVPKVNEVLANISEKLTKKYPGIEIHCLDANFPFLNGFPLPPHLSHKDGKKLDISLLYEDQKGVLVNEKPSVSGYGAFVYPTNGEYDQISVCKRKGYWQYDFPKYLTLGTVYPELNFSEKGTKTLLQLIAQEASISKIFIEPHLRDRMNINHVKIRYHGCKAVRHDDHIHIQVR
ncbi:hypothetical protein [uncultured Dokdonia sp.]|uniref:hypothetical protein n=1 Tax=uncultured Dokdonia sp. TaxID=575653 RepID=UPI002606EF24|nr:hypothetical protein [uncultured Dokdonia sp.]